MKKVACLGNMNNNLFQIGRYLLDEGYDVTFFLFDEFEHFKPQADVYDGVSSFNIINLNWNIESFERTSTDEIKQPIVNFDTLIGTDVAPAFLAKAGISLDVFVPHGSDLYDYPFVRFKNSPPQAWELKNYFFSLYQFTGIQCATVIAMDPSEVVYEEPLNFIKGNNDFKRIDAMPFLYLPQYSWLDTYTSEIVQTFQQLRKQYDFICFQHGSQDWSNRGPYKINKGNDLLIKGFAQYLAVASNKKDSLLVLVEYGNDVQKSKELIKQLGIEKQVYWLPKLNRKDIMKIISEIDIGIGELGYRRWYSYGCIFEYMALGKPIVHHRDDEYYRSLGADLYHMFNAKSEADICEIFSAYRRNPTPFKELGNKSKYWLEARTKKAVLSTIQIIENKPVPNPSWVVKQYRRKIFRLKHLVLLTLDSFYRFKNLVKS